MKLPAQQQLEELTRLFNEQWYAQAEILATALTQEFPTHPFGWKVLGSVTKKLGNPEAALGLMRKAAHLVPHDAEIHANIGNTLRELQRPQEAVAAYLQAIHAAPSFVNAHVNLGATLRELGRFAEAAERLQHALGIQPDSAAALSNLALTCHDLGQLAKAEALCLQALKLQPDFLDALNNLGLILRDTGRPKEAEAQLRRALSLDTQFAAAHSNLGNVLKDLGDSAGAIACYRAALSINPNNPEAHNNLGVSLLEKYEYPEAKRHIERALAIKPDFVDALCNMGIALLGQGHAVEAQSHVLRALQLDPACAIAHNSLGNIQSTQGNATAAAASYDRAIALDPQFPDALNNLGILWHESGQFERAAACYRRALDLRASHCPTLVNLGCTQMAVGQFDAAISSFEKALAIQPDLREAHANLLFVLNYHPDKSAEEVYSAYVAYDRQFGEPHRARQPAPIRRAQPGQRLRVGYVSPDFRQHSCLYCLEPLLANHDRTRFEVFAYAELAFEDDITSRYKGYVDHWIATKGMSDEALFERVRSDGIDILVDIAGHTRGNRLQVFARKPAPVSLSWLGFGYTTGLSAIDYFLTDAHAVPGGSEGLFSETPWRLDGPAFAYRAAPGMGEPGALPAARNGHVTFGTLTRAVRINHKCIRVWSQILQRLPNARLVINSSDYRSSEMQEALAQRFLMHGIEREQLRIGYQSPPWDVLREIDITLDCFPHNSGTTLLESLYMGVPFVTLAGRAGVGTLGSAVLHGAGHPEWIAATEETYATMAVALATDLAALTATRATLRRQLQASPLMDEAAFARRVEAAYGAMWAAAHAADATDPSQAEADLLLSLYSQQRYSELEVHARALTGRCAGYAMGWKALGIAARHFGRDAEALAAMQKAADLLPNDAEAHNNLGVMHKQLGQLAQAQAYYQKALAINPGYADAHINLGRVLHDLGRAGEALDCYKQALAIKPGAPDALNSLGLALDSLGRAQEAEACYRQALAAKPDYAEAHCNLGTALHNLGKLDEAERSLRLALQFNPSLAEAWNSLGIVCSESGRHDEAEACYRRALAFRPDYAQAHSNLGNTLRDKGDFAASLASFEKAIQLKPGLADAHDNLLFALNYHPDCTAEQIFCAYQRYEQIFGRPLRSLWRPHRRAAVATRRLKVGYVSPDFRRHSCRFFLEPLMARHDKAAFEVFAYAELAQEDATTGLYKRHADHWIPTRGMADDELAERIRTDGIDILVDVAGHTRGNRLQVFARKPAPVSVSWLGFGYTTGLQAIDYYLSDHFAVPSGAEPLFSETVWRLNGPYFSYQAAPGMGEVGPPPALANQHITFGSLTRAVRINHRTIRVWAEILKRVKGAMLVIDSADFQHRSMQDALADKFAGHGIDRERLVIGCHSPPWDVLRGMDITLDCFPHNCGTTLVESLYMGVPFVTLAGRAGVGRLGSSILQGLGHPEWIAYTEDAYVETAVALAQNPLELSNLRATLRAKMLHGPLMDSAGFATQVEQAYRQMWMLALGRQQHPHG